LFKALQGLLFGDIVNLGDKRRLLNLFLEGLSFLRRQVFFEEDDNGQVAAEFFSQTGEIVREGNKNP
jgi:hypothetical protein